MKSETFILDGKATIGIPEHLTKPVEHAINMLFRDIEKVFGIKPVLSTEIETASIVIEYTPADDVISSRQEAFAIRFINSAGKLEPAMHICGSDDLGIIYGMGYTTI